MEDGSISDSEISASSFFPSAPGTELYAPWYGRLNMEQDSDNGGAWIPDSADANPYIEVYLRNPPPRFYD